VNDLVRTTMSPPKTWRSSSTMRERSSSTVMPSSSASAAVRRSFARRHELAELGVDIAHVPVRHW
ncbi:hypothetical protein, partial [Nocardia cyriacigeorgica]|uniref:hypothetical protein n=1 Tax=Nocardia cyriacigeorgica TaxID=135487 RepID=UPI00245473F6